MDARPMIRGWVALVAMSAMTTALTLLHPEGAARLAVGALVLLLAGLKARVILRRYLALERSRFWSSGFSLAIGIFLLLALALYGFAGRV